MKKILFLAIAALAFALVPFQDTKAQAYVYNEQAKTAAGVKKDTLTNTDTSYATVLAAENHLQALRAVVTKVSGDNSSVRIYLEARTGAAGTNSDGNWDLLDSLVCTNQTTNKKTFNLRTTSGNLLYKDYRTFNKGAGTAASIVKVYQVRRSN